MHYSIIVITFYVNISWRLEVKETIESGLNFTIKNKIKIFRMNCTDKENQRIKRKKIN